MSPTRDARRTFGLRVLGGGTDLADRVSLDFDQRLFRRNYRRPVLAGAALSAEAADVDRWLAAGADLLLGCDVAARVLNRIASEAAEPLYLHALVWGGSRETREAVRGGIADACLAADCTFLTGSADEAASAGKLSIAVAATGVVERRSMMSRRRFEPGDVVLAVGSDRLWPALVEPARKLLAEQKPGKPLARLPFDAAGALVQPAPVLAGHLQTVLRRYTVKRVVHAVVPVEGDGLAAAIERLTAGTFDVKRSRARRACSELLSYLLGHGLARQAGDAADEGHLLGIGLLMVVSPPFAGAIARRFRRLGAPAYTFGRFVPRGAS